jgi:hypothetical protein
MTVTDLAFVARVAAPPGLDLDDCHRGRPVQGGGPGSAVDERAWLTRPLFGT